MTRFIFVAMFAGLVGCGKDDCDDTAAGACDTGESHEDHDHDGDEDGGEEGGEEAGGEEGGEEAGGEEGGDDGSAASASCQFGSDICIETTAADPGAWCDTEGGTSNEAACGDDYTSHCDIPGGQEGTYADAATAYYYNDFDGEIACEDYAGGEYTVAGDGGGSDDYDTAEPEDDWGDTGATP